MTRTSQGRSRFSVIPKRLILVAVIGMFAYLVYFVLFATTHRIIISHDYVADLEASFAEHPPDQHAWPILRGHVTELRAAANERFMPGISMPPSDDDVLGFVVSAGSEHVRWLDEVEPPVAYSPLEDWAWRGAITLEQMPVTPDEIRSFFREQQPHIAGIREASARPSLGIPYSFGYVRDPDDQAFFLSPQEIASQPRVPAGQAQMRPSMLEILLPHLTTFRSMSMLLAADAVLAAESGDGTRATDDLIAMLRLAEITRQDGFVITEVVMMSMKQDAFDRTIDLLTLVPDSFSDADLARLAEILDSPVGTIAPLTYEGERIFFLDFIQRTYSDDGNGNGILMLEGFESFNHNMPGNTGIGTMPSVVQALLAPIIGSVAMDRKEAISRFDAMISEVRMIADQDPWAIDWSTYDRMEGEMTPRGNGFLDTLSSFPFTILMANHRPILERYFLCHARRDQVRVILALTRYHRANGNWPDTLEQLVPEFLAEVPLDPCDGAALRYALRDDRPLLWSVGNDGLDEEGRAPAPGATYEATRKQDDAARLEFGSFGANQPAGQDWIFWRGPRTP